MNEQTVQATLGLCEEIKPLHMLQHTKWGATEVINRSLQHIHNLAYSVSLELYLYLHGVEKHSLTGYTLEGNIQSVICNISTLAGMVLRYETRATQDFERNVQFLLQNICRKLYAIRRSSEESFYGA